MLRPRPPNGGKINSLIRRRSPAFGAAEFTCQPSPSACKTSFFYNPLRPLLLRQMFCRTIKLLRDYSKRKGYRQE